MKMVEPEKPFACGIPDCGKTFTNEDHLHVHTKKHDMMLLGLEQKAVFVADQTPTPTRFIRNCEDLGIFQDLQNVNPFDEGFKQAMETAKHGLLSLENAAVDTLRCQAEGSMPPDADVLHTPQFIDPRDATMYSSNNHITISRSSSDESGVIKEYETTTISKLTNEVTTISRVVNKHDVIDRHDDVTGKDDDANNETSVSYTNNVIQIHNNIEIRKDNLINIDTAKVLPINFITYDQSKDSSNVAKDVMIDTKDSLKLPPIMSQKSLDYVVDSLTTDICKGAEKTKTPNETKNNVNTKIVEEIKDSDKSGDYEVIIKLPNGKQVRMRSVEETATKIESNTKEKLKMAINNKVSQRNTVLHSIPGINTSIASINTSISGINTSIPGINTSIPSILPIPAGTLIPVTIVNSTQVKIPIAPFHPRPSQLKKTVKRKGGDVKRGDKGGDDKDDDCVIVDDVAEQKKSRADKDSRVGASWRYRVRLKENMRKQVEELKSLREMNQRLIEEKAALQLLITEHLKRCPDADHLRATQANISQAGSSMQ